MVTEPAGLRTSITGGVLPTAMRSLRTDMTISLGCGSASGEAREVAGTPTGRRGAGPGVADRGGDGADEPGVEGRAGGGGGGLRAPLEGVGQPETDARHGALVGGAVVVRRRVLGTLR